MDAIVIMGGSLTKGGDGWRTTRFDEGDDFGAMGDRVRVVAGCYLYQDVFKKRPELFVLAAGGRGRLRDAENAPTVSSVMKKELIELGIPQEKIVLEEHSYNTFQQLQALHQIVSGMQSVRMTIISNRYHLSRIKALIEYGPGLEDLKFLFISGELNLRSAEEIVLEYERPRWEGVITEAYQSESMRKRVVSEQQGVAQIEDGSYRFD